MHKKRVQYKLCVDCNNIFAYYDAKTYICPSCKQTTLPCKCGCGKAVKKYSGDSCVLSSGYSAGCKTRGKSKETKGKTYLEIYGTSTPACGFRSGVNNIAKQENIRIKISLGVKKNYVDHPEVITKKVESRRKTFFTKGYPVYGKMKSANSLGHKFRSILEANFSDFLIAHNIAYTYEKPFRLADGSVKVVDFVIDDILIEISGYAHTSWQEEFNRKIILLHNTYPDKQIILLTYGDKVELLNLSVNKECNVYSKSIVEMEEFLKTFTWCKQINYANIKLKEMDLNE